MKKELLANGGGSGYSASGSASSDLGTQVRTGDINNQTGLVIPGWAIPVAIAAVVVALIVGLILFAPSRK